MTEFAMMFLGITVLMLVVVLVSWLLCKIAGDAADEYYESEHRYYCKQFHEKGLDDYPHKCFRDEIDVDK